MMLAKVAVAAMSIAAALVAAEAAGAASPKVFWSVEKAEAAGAKTVRIQWCRVYPIDAKCVNGPATVGVCCAQRPATIECQGLDEKRGTFTYARFACRVTVGYTSRQSGRWVQMGSGTIAIWPVSPVAMRWKTLSFASAVG